MSKKEKRKKEEEGLLQVVVVGSRSTILSAAPACALFAKILAPKRRSSKPLLLPSFFLTSRIGVLHPSRIGMEKSKGEKEQVSGEIQCSVDGVIASTLNQPFSPPPLFLSAKVKKKSSNRERVLLARSSNASPLPL